MCAECGVPTLPVAPGAVAGFLTAVADRVRKVRTLGRRLAAIRYAHRLRDLAPPTEHEAVRMTLRGIRRTLGTGRPPPACA